jgi:hypothetical protein
VALKAGGVKGTAPTAPSGLGATADGQNAIDLAWTDHASTETGFLIQRSPDDATWSDLATVGPNVSSYEDSGLTAATLYYYRVRAYNGWGASDWAASASATTASAGQTFTDSFNRADSAVTLGSTDTGQAWTAHSGTWGITGNQAYCAVDDAGHNVATFAAAADGTLQVTLVDPAGGSGGAAWLVFRSAADASQFIYLECSTIAPCQLYTYDAGVAVALDTGSPVAAGAGDVVEIVLLGTAIEVYVNDVLVIEATSSFQQTATRVGLGTDFGLDGSVRFDALSFTS